ncbi:signal peptidase complex subunit 2-like isoform X2 [Magnolia sinica]|uniref:signal peptidase complex subunit 2-like isoform X2 n=1 Tax=Magnolia sinica TaxID=86752 RepID=UPI00265A30C8|nr:signal peptidase complex subunit 2-like isoform X2 [Magnolia sinica]
MASNDISSSPKPNPKKANLMDPHSIKNLLDKSVSEIVTGRGYIEDMRLSNIRLLMGTVIIAIALVAQLGPKKFPKNKDFLIGCIALYIVFNGLLQLIIYKKEKNAILFTYPLLGIHSPLSPGRFGRSWEPFSD